MESAQLANSVQFAKQALESVASARATNAKILQNLTLVWKVGPMKRDTTAATTGLGVELSMTGDLRPSSAITASKLPPVNRLPIVNLSRSLRMKSAALVIPKGFA
jgi:hypothetical protein